ncbi:MAG: protein kinase domain-containing protein [Pyrinomonadaceae bacterium]
MIETGKFLQQRYRIDKQIGQGGMGAVYVATDERFGSRVAIKETLFMDDNFRKAIEREARLLNSLKHPALPRVTDHFEEDNGQFLVMEYIAGEDVATILEREQRPFPVEQVLKWADELLDALDYLHNQTMPVVHRDIKPQNLKITPKGDVILLDFGLAKGNPTDASQQTAAKSIFGYSKNYASLEQIQGSGTDPRSDLYSLAATLYHLLTNVVPEDALSRAMSVLSQKGDPLLPANMVEPSVPKGIAGALYQAMSLNADHRPESAAAMREMLRNADQYGHLTDNIQHAAQTVQMADVFAHKTRLMQEGTNAAPQHEVKTEVLAGEISQETRVHSGAALAATTDSPRRAQGVGFLAGIGAVAVLACVAAAGVYMVKPSLFDGSSAAQQPANQTAAPNEAPQAPASAAVTASNSNSTAAAPAPETGQNTRTSETAKSNKKTNATKNEDGSGPDETVVQVPAAEGDLPPGGMVVTKKNPDGTTTTTRIVPRPPVPGDRYNPFPPGFDPGMYRYMSPAERQQVRDAIKKARDQQKQNQRGARPQPRPEDTPPDSNFVDIP